MSSLNLEKSQSLNDNHALMPLSMAGTGETVQLVAIHGGHRLRHRLAELGLNVGMTVRLVQSDATGPVILAIHNDSRLAIGRGMAHKIMVTPRGETQT